MAEAYATFAARGNHCNVDRDPRGRPTRPATGSPCRRPTASRCSTRRSPTASTSCCRASIERGTGTRAAIGPAGGRQDRHHQPARLACGSSATRRDLATAVWAGNPSARPAAATRCSNRADRRRYYGDVCGGCLPGPIWQQMMSRTPGQHPGLVVHRSRRPTIVNGEPRAGADRDRHVASSRRRRCCARPALDPVVSDNPVYVDYAPAGTVAYSFPGPARRSTPASGSCSTSAPARRRPSAEPGLAARGPGETAAPADPRPLRHVPYRWPGGNLAGP